MPLPPLVTEVATAYDTQQQQIAERAVTLLGFALERGSSPEAWRDAIAGIGEELIALQVLSASLADDYLTAVLEAQGADPAALAAVNADAWADTTDGGGSWLRYLVFAPASVQENALAAGLSFEAAVAQMQTVASSVLITGLRDTARSSVQAGMQARPSVQGYVRMLRHPSCARCVILAGKRSNRREAFKRHRHCFPAGVVVSGPPTAAATRRWYQGELVILTTASGQELPLTGNHPVLTTRGWVPANLIKEGDEVVRSTRPEGATSLVVPDHQQVPTPIEDVWGSLRVSGLFGRMPTTTEDFHGDGLDGEVDVVAADGLLRSEGKVSFLQELREGHFAYRGEAADSLKGKSVRDLLFLGTEGTPHGLMSSGSLSEALFLSHLGGAHGSSLTHAPHLHAGFLQATPYDVPADAVLQAEGVLAGPVPVGADDLLNRENLVPTRWDAAGDASTMQGAVTNARVGRDLLFRLSGQVETDRVVHARRIEWSGHVYNLNSSEGWFSANGLIVSNCDCVNIPTSEDSGDFTTRPAKYFKSLSREEQDRIFTKAGAEAIRLSGVKEISMNQIVNARQGIDTVTAYGRKIQITREGTTVRALYGGYEVLSKPLPHGGFLRRRGDDELQRVPGVRYRVAKAPRLLPDEIFRLADDFSWDRAEMLRQLQRFGYLTP